MGSWTRLWSAIRLDTKRGMTGEVKYLSFVFCALKAARTCIPKYLCLCSPVVLSDGPSEGVLRWLH